MSPSRDRVSRLKAHRPTGQSLGMSTEDATYDISLLLIEKKADYGLAPRKWRAALERMRALPEFETDEEHRMSQITHEDDRRVAALVWLRYGVPAAIFLLRCVLLAIGGGGEIGWEGFFMATGAALSVLLLNLFYRLSVSDASDREAEEAARDFYSRHGHWPDEDPH
jgi:hypothetical protein